MYDIKNFRHSFKNFDKSLAVGKFTRADKNAKLLNLLGNFYYADILVEENLQRALEFYRKAAELKNSTAFVNLGKVYEGEKNLEQAKYYYEQLINKTYNGGKYHEFNFVSYDNEKKYVYSKTPDSYEVFLTQFAEQRIQKLFSAGEVENKND